MEIISNYHTHTYLCRHATGTIDEIVNRALQLNYKYIGISDHGPLTEYFRIRFTSRRMSEEEYYQNYLSDLKLARDKYKNKITVLGAVEIEFDEELLSEYRRMLLELDYLVLGQHFININGKYQDIYSNLDTTKIKIYADTVVKAIETGYFRILAHPDIFCFSYHDWDEACIECTKRIVEACIKHHVYLEINANGIRKKMPYLNQYNEKIYLYPNLNFWKMASDILKNTDEALVLISDDAHEVESIGDWATYKAYDFAESLNIKIRSHL